MAIRTARNSASWPYGRVLALSVVRHQLNPQINRNVGRRNILGSNPIRKCPLDVGSSDMDVNETVADELKG